MSSHEIFRLSADEDGEGTRLDRFLAGCLEGQSREYLTRLISGGMVRVNGAPVKKNYRIRTGDLLEVELPEPEPLEVEPEDIPLEILYEDTDLIVVNKPRGMVVHPAPGSTRGTLVNALLHHCRDLSGINGVMRPGIVHRIDKDTSGILVVAKTDRAHQELAVQFKDHTICRRYQALVHGQIEETAGRVEAPIGRDPSDRKRMAVNLEHGKEAATEYRVLERFPGYSLVELTLETGRTHQIRVHMKMLGFPLVGDDKYHGRKNPFGVRGQMLHAGFLGFVHPVTGESMEFSCEPPEEFKNVLNILRREETTDHE